MKLLVTLCLMATLATVAWTGSVSWGTRTYGDYLIYYENVVRWPQYHATHNVQVDFPKWGQTNTRNISAIYVYDNFRNNSGATAKLLSGGPKYKFARIHLMSLPSRGINSTVAIYGR